MAYELQALKGYIQSLVTGGSNFAYIGGFRNKLKNGGFKIAQRGTSVTVASGITAYTLDQWVVSSPADATVVNQLQGPVTNSSCLQMLPGAAIGALQLSSNAESADCLDLVVGTSVVVSGMYYVGNAATGVPAIQLFTGVTKDNFGGTVLCAPAQSLGNTVPLQNGTWVFFKNVFVLATAAVNCLRAIFTWGAGVTASQDVRFANVQVEVGLQYTPFEQRPIASVLQLCQRYYQVLGVLINGYGTAGNTITIVVNYPTPMRTAPTVTRAAVTLINATFPGGPSIFSSQILDVISVTGTGGAEGAYSAQMSAEL